MEANYKTMWEDLKQFIQKNKDFQKQSDKKDSKQKKLIYRNILRKIEELEHIFITEVTYHSCNKKIPEEETSKCPGCNTIERSNKL